jgi:hypothetical protein
MASKLIKRVKSILLKNNIRISETTEKQKLLDFISSVKPVKTNHELIRIGGSADGGYLVPNDFENVKVCFSPGVSDVADFEVDLAKRGIKSFLADYSVDAPPVSNSLFYFEKKFLGVKESDIYMTLESWISRNASDESNMILQMDIENAEYGVILNTSSEALKKFRTLIIEFHHLDSLCEKMGYELINLTFSKILKDFEVVHIHPNNVLKPINYKGILIPPIMEFTFIKKDRITQKTDTLSFPHKLDKKNDVNKKDFALPKCWYEQT